MPDKPAWCMPVHDVFTAFKTSEKGLTSQEATKRLKVHGHNEVASRSGKSWPGIFLSQFRNPLILILMAASAISYFLSDPIDATVILAIVLVNAVLGFFQEYRAERALCELRKYVTHKCVVVQNGIETRVDAKDLVPGDVVHLHVGDVVPADVRLFRIEDFTCDESSLTGESVAVIKSLAVVSEKHDLPYQLTNMAFMGTSVESGTAMGVVVATGKNTSLGRTSAYLSVARETDFQKSIAEFGTFLLNITLVMTALIFVANALLGKGVFDSFMFALALAVGITPEMLPIIMTLTLSNGALKMAKKEVIVKRLVSVEDFGNVDILCCDKTGTLTKGTMFLQDYLDLDGKKDHRLVTHGLLCNAFHRRGRHFGNQIDTAIWNSREARKHEPALFRHQILDENEFDFKRRRMSVLVKGSKTNTLLVKGAPESLLSVSTHALRNGKRTSLSRSLKLELNRMVEAYQKEGRVVIAVGEKQTPKSETTKTDESGLMMTGLLLFSDPPKETANEALKSLQKLGVGIKVLSGDNPFVTRKVCEEVGLQIDGDHVVTGYELERLSREQFADHARQYNVFSRVTPEQKYLLVDALKKQGHVLGFLGDGINDAPALKLADVGISVDSAAGIAKEAADVILLRKSLRVLAQGIVEGRKTFSNILKYVLNTISANTGNMFTVAVASLLLPFLPLLPSQILLNNLISDIPLLTVATDNVDHELLKKPRRWSLKLITQFMLHFGLLSSLFDFALILPLLFVFNTLPAAFRTAWFIESSLSEIIVTFAIRTKLPFFRSKPSGWLLWTSILSGILIVGIPYTNAGRELFQFVPLSVHVLALITGVVIAYFTSAEAGKRWFFKRFEL